MKSKITPYRILCALLTAVYICHSAGFSARNSEFVSDLLSTAILLALLRVSWQQSRFRPGAVLIAVISALCFWLDSLILPSSYSLISSGLLAVIEMTCAVLIVSDVLSNQAVGSDDIFGCIGAYLLIAFAFAGIFQILDTALSTSLLFNSTVQKSFSAYLYLSFMNLTTLGYGDIVPASDLSRAVCVLQAACGQLYIAVVIAHLMGFHLHSRLKQHSRESIPAQDESRASLRKADFDQEIPYS